MRRLSKQPAERDLHRAPVQPDGADLLRRQADWLTGVDRTLLTLYIQAGCSFQQIGRLTGMNRSSISRRIRKILRRLSDRTYLACLASRDRFSDQEMDVLRDHLIRGLSLARIARDSGLRYYRVRAIVDKARDISQPAQS
ncbi:MAG TPA: hypothetical protein VLI39_00330 [Sedimentisphaerales bacterium]|nr:hypothetical protein [Sedimentisphaerales bacterium]